MKQPIQVNADNFYRGNISGVDEVLKLSGFRGGGSGPGLYHNDKTTAVVLRVDPSDHPWTSKCNEGELFRIYVWDVPLCDTLLGSLPIPTRVDDCT